MTLMMAELEASAQALVDARLDTIDRMLVGRVPRADRLAIVREVEAQIFELLPADEPGPIDRSAILAVLRRLDPPEAYLPDAGERIDPPSPRTLRQGMPAAPTRAGVQRLALWSGVLGIVALVGSVVLPVVSYLLAALFNSEVFLLLAAGFTGMLVIAAAVVAIVLGVRSRRESGWGIAGLVTGIVGGVISVLMTGALMFILLTVD